MSSHLVVAHADCYRELCHVERERDDLRLELATLRAEHAQLKAEVEVLARALRVAETDNSW